MSNPKEGVCPKCGEFFTVEDFCPNGHIREDPHPDSFVPEDPKPVPFNPDPEIEDIQPGTSGDIF